MPPIASSQKVASFGWVGFVSPVIHEPAKNSQTATVTKWKMLGNSSTVVWSAFCVSRS